MQWVLNMSIVPIHQNLLLFLSRSQFGGAQIVLSGNLIQYYQKLALVRRTTHSLQRLLIVITCCYGGKEMDLMSMLVWFEFFKFDINA